MRRADEQRHADETGRPAALAIARETFKRAVQGMLRQILEPTVEWSAAELA